MTIEHFLNRVIWCPLSCHEMLFLIISKHPFVFYFPAQIAPQTTFGCCFIYRNVASMNLSYFHEPNIAFELLCPCRHYEMPTANVPAALFKPRATDYIQIQIGIFPPLSTPVHIKQKRPLRKDVSAHSNDLPSKLLAHATKQTLYSSAAWEASHKQRQCRTCEFTSVPSRWCQCKKSCWGPFTRFYVNLQLLNSMSQSVCPFVARHRRFWGCLSRANNMHRSYNLETLTYTCSK